MKDLIIALQCVATREAFLKLCRDPLIGFCLPGRVQKTKYLSEYGF